MSGAQPIATAHRGRAKRGARLLLPVFLRPSRILRFFRDPKASLGSKLLLLAAVAYVVLPIDLVPDVAPLVGWLDDLGVVAVALGWIARRVAEHGRDDAEAVRPAEG